MLRQTRCAVQIREHCRVLRTQGTGYRLGACPRPIAVPVYILELRTSAVNGTHVTDAGSSAVTYHIPAARSEMDDEFILLLREIH